MLSGIAHMKLTEANGIAKVINLSTNIAALIVYLCSGKIAVLLGLTAGAFSIAGIMRVRRLLSAAALKFQGR